MQAKNETLFTRTIYGDFMRFALASLVVGLVAAMLLSSAVLALSSPAPTSVNPQSGGGAV
jgi:hypothetical protein